MSIVYKKKGSDASKISIIDANDNFTSDNVEGALEELNTQCKDISNIGELTNLNTNAKDNLVNAINEVFQNASNGKTLIAQAITGKGILTNANDSFQTMATNISNIKSEEETIECTGLILSKATLTFSDLITKQALSVTVAPPDSTYPVFWYSTNENIATVSNGVVTPITNGSCSIIV